jgi:hypothetical protein
VRGSRIALAACVLFATPAIVAQPIPPQGPASPHVRTIPPFKRPHPPARPRAPHRPVHRQNPVYPVVIDGSLVDRYLATPTPAPKRTAPPRSKNGQDVFETHSTGDAK